MTNIQTQKAFTLIEILIASTISLVVMLTILSAFRTGVFGYHDIDQTLSTERGACQALERIRLDLKNSLVYSDKLSGFSGEANGMSFLTLVDIYQGNVWRREYALVSYRWNGKALVRLSRLGADALNEQASGRTEELEMPTGKFALQYGTLDHDSGSLVYTDKWEPAQGVPVAVKVDMTFNEVPFEKIVILPTAKLP